VALACRIRQIPDYRNTLNVAAFVMTYC
jgi:hypothetical protein